MKIQKTKHLKSFLFALLGLCLLLAPMLIEFVHVVSKFHVATEFCTDTSDIHLSEDELDCPICNSHLSFYSFDFQELNLETITSEFPIVFLFKSTFTKEQDTTHYLLRGPPLFV